jgi:hypothetical protein
MSIAAENLPLARQHYKNLSCAAMVFEKFCRYRDTTAKAAAAPPPSWTSLISKNTSVCCV